MLGSFKSIELSLSTDLTLILTKNCVHTLSCAPPLSFRSKSDWSGGKTNKEWRKSSDQNSALKLTLNESAKQQLHANFDVQLTKQSRCFYPRMSSRGRCTAVPDGGTSSCCLRTPMVCLLGKRSCLPRLLQPVSGRAQHSQQRAHYS